MKPEHILLICAGGVFVLLLLIYFAIGIKSEKTKRDGDKQLLQSYSEENLHKMEYDVAFYEGEAFKIFALRDNAQQVTIDDILASSTQDISEMTERAIFSQLEDEGVEEIVGTYNPAK